MRAGLLSGTAAAHSSQSGDSIANNMGSANDIPALAVGVPGHADILREASHYLSAIKVSRNETTSLQSLFHT